MNGLLAIKCLLLVSVVLVAVQSMAQTHMDTTIQGRARNYPDLPDSVMYGDVPGFARDSVYQVAPVSGKPKCRNNSGLYLVYKPLDDAQAARELPSAKEHPSNSLLKIHGNVLYDLDYRSNIDTPYAEKDIYQHTIQTYLDIAVKNQYPIRVYLTNRFSNSHLFKNFTNLNMQFNPHEFENKVKLALQNELLHRPALKDSLPEMKLQLDKLTGELITRERWPGSSYVLQRQVAENEALALQKRGIKLPADSIHIPSWKDSLANLEAVFNKGGLPGNWSANDINFSALDSIRAANAVNRNDSASPADTKSIQVEIRENEARIDSLRKIIQRLQAAYVNRKNSAGSNDQQVKNDINHIHTIAELDSVIKVNHIPDTSLPKGYRTLFAVKSLGIGRNLVDYSELSARNVSVTGLEVEYNPSYYAAFATGVIDYQFRDYIIQRTNAPRQYFTALRYGAGQKEGNHLILTYYTGSRQLYNSSTTVQGTPVANSKLMGFTLEGQYKITPVTYLTGELAKSTIPYYNSSNQAHQLTGITAFNNRSNEAYSIKLNTIVVPTSTRITAFYKKYGANFQSFSFFTTGTEQHGWMVKADQPFFKKRLTLTGSIKENDFSNPLVAANYKSNTVFKSIQATWRMQKWPVISVGYYPSSQLTRLSDNSYTENLFYTLVGNISYFYKIKSIQTSTSLVYTQFYNKAGDSGFVYFNTRNLLLNETVFLKRFTLQGNAAIATNSDYHLYTLENDVQYALTSWLRLGGGGKYNYQTGYRIRQYGYRAEAEIGLKKIGSIQVMYDKGFIPGPDKKLVQNNVGRVTYFKIF